MELLLESDDKQFLAQAREELINLVQTHGLADRLYAGQVTADPSQPIERGAELVSVWTVLLAAAGAGGALTVAVSEKGFLTQLARVLEKYIESRRIRAVIVETPKGGKRLELEGSARQVEKTLLAYLADEDPSSR